MTIAITRRERRRGLRGTERLDPDDAMFFPRCQSVHTFGMRFTILVAWLDSEYRVISMRRVPPRRLAMHLRARHALECSVDADVHVGDVIRADEPRADLEGVHS